MAGLRVSELARRAGVTPSAVRFYERAGLLTRASRGANGYRLFDEAAVDQLKLVARAKAIGMSLQDAAGLTAAWPGGDCRSVRARIRGFLAGRVGQVREQRAALRALERRLLTALGRLPAQDRGPAICAPDCGCDAALDPNPGATPPAGRDTGGWGCTLDAASVAARVGEWRALAAAATSVERADGAVRLVLPAEPDLVAAAAALCAAETACCGQTRFVLEVTPGQAALTAQAPGAPGLVEAMIPG